MFIETIFNVADGQRGKFSKRIKQTRKIIPLIFSEFKRNLSKFSYWAKFFKTKMTLKDGKKINTKNFT